MRSISWRGAWSACLLIALMATALSVTACGAAGAAKAPPAAGPASTTTMRHADGAGAAPPTATLTWTPVTLPAGVSLAAGASIGVSPVDGHIAWLCAPADASAASDPNATSATFTVWDTRDAGVTWTQQGQLTQAVVGAATCRLLADAASPHALVAQVGWGCGECGTLTAASFYSANDGGAWSATPGLSLAQEVATISGAEFAIAANSAAPPSEMAMGVVVSRDNFHSWRFIRPGGLPSNDGFFHFWLSTDGATLVAASYNGALWRTDDQGATWTQLPARGSQQITNGVWLEQRQTFLFCTGGGTASTIVCSDDYGASWSERPFPTTTVTCKVKCGGVTTQTNACDLGGLTADGALIADCVTAPGVDVLYLLKPDATTWGLIASNQDNVIVTIPVAGPMWGGSDTGDGISSFATATLPA